MVHPMSVIRSSIALAGLALLVISVPAFAEEQQCTFCSPSAVSQESGPPQVTIGTQQAGGQQCSFCAGVQGEALTISSRESVAAKTIPGKAIMAASMSPAEGYGIHVQAPHMMHDGTVGGPFHHYCKGISDQILQCLLFESTDPKAPLVAIEYFVSKDLSRKLPVIQWHRYFHDHKVEIATGRVQVLDVPHEKAQAIAEAASKTDGVIYHLWQKGKEFPDGSVTFPQSLGHTFPQPN